MDISNRLEILVREEKSQAAFARKTGINRISLNSIIQRGTGIRSATLQQIAKAYPNLNVRWLLNGEGQMWIDAESPDPDAISGQEMTDEPESVFERFNKVLEQRVMQLEDEIKQLDPDRAKRLGID